MNPDHSEDEYFIVENRQQGTHYDRNLGDQGLAVWHIMENPDIYNNVAPPPAVSQQAWDTTKNDWGRRAIRMLRPRLSDPFNDHQALWDGTDPRTGYDLLSEDPDPNHTTLRWADGTPSPSSHALAAASRSTLNNLLLQGKIDPQSARAASENYKWVASRASRRYADKQTTELTGANGKDLIPDQPKLDDRETARLLAWLLTKGSKPDAVDAGELVALPNPEAGR